jgi:ferredoxin
MRSSALMPRRLDRTPAHKGHPMPYKIVASQCTSCSACEPECPNVAISEKNGTFFINPKKCTECLGHFDIPQCVAVCPVDNTCIIDTSLPRSPALA